MDPDYEYLVTAMLAVQGVGPTVARNVWVLQA